MPRTLDLRAHSDGYELQGDVGVRRQGRVRLRQGRVGLRRGRVRPEHQGQGDSEQRQHIPADTSPLVSSGEP